MPTTDPAELLELLGADLLGACREALLLLAAGKPEADFQLGRLDGLTAAVAAVAAVPPSLVLAHVYDAVRDGRDHLSVLELLVADLAGR